MTASTALLKIVDPKNYYESYLSAGVYPEGRSLRSFPRLSFKQGECGGVGSSLVSSGGVTVSCSIEASVSLCNDLRLITASVAPTTQLSEKESNEITSCLIRLLDQGSFVSKEALRCKNVDGEDLPLTWNLEVVIKIMSADGCLMDAIICSVVTALRNVKLPLIRLNHLLEDESSIEKNQILIERQSVSLNDVHVLMCCTFGLFLTKAGEEIVLCAPNSDELNNCAAKYVMIVSGEEEIVLLTGNGSSKVFDNLRIFNSICSKRWKLFKDALDKPS
ncbi:unnamed protein product [Caenorhabditis auriculariae]|uniref:Ribosomal RNA-processing protein 43 n=1 Tax=Caenorhabditis auriculariae TaxID=2777116 RepID=A0A8S1H178_9PELO|nr:unnamed protein product [Caenorhabditis auriculariae]